MVATAESAPEVHLALQALQHRGQDSAGIGTMVGDGRTFAARRGLGTVVQALPAAALEALQGPLAIGHVRYPTIGKGKLEDTQPFFYRQPGVLMAHNGNLTNYSDLESSLRDRSIHLLSRCDVEPALCELADALMGARKANHTRSDLIAAVRQMQSQIRGAYSIVAGLLLEGVPTLMLVRDPHGIRPAVVGRRKAEDGKDAWLVASESVALDTLDFEREFEPKPGEIVLLRSGHEPERFPAETVGTAKPCVFEHIYFARPDATIDGQVVYEVRLGLGRSLAERVREKGIEADVVIPVPDTARPAATAMSELLSLPLREGFIKNRYSGRTFIMPDALTRQAALRLKLNTLPSELRGRRVLLVDDSIVRGATLRRVIGAMRRAGVLEVHLAIHSPPVKHPCFYGIDMSTEEELFARRFDGPLERLEVAAAEELEADSLTYLSVEGMNKVFGAPRCGACFDGDYPEAIVATQREQIVQDRRSLGPKTG
jgi:amidophosphoribosyltransferase